MSIEVRSIVAVTVESRGFGAVTISAVKSVKWPRILLANKQRDDHIRSADFFEVDKYPTMAYRSTGLRRDGDDFILDGDLTLKGVTRQVPLKLEVNGFGPDPFAPDPLAGARAGFTATGEINRMEFGVSYNGPIPGGGVALGDKVQIVLEIEAALKTRT